MTDRLTRTSSPEEDLISEDERELLDLRATTKSHLEAIVGLRPRGTNMNNDLSSATLGKRILSEPKGSWLIGPIAKILEIDESKTVSVILGFPVSGGSIPEYIRLFQGYNGRELRLTMWGDQGRVDSVDVTVDHRRFTPNDLEYHDKPEHARQSIANEVLSLISQDLQEARVNWRQLLSTTAEEALDELDKRYEHDSPRGNIKSLIKTMQAAHPNENFVVLLDPEAGKEKEGVNILLLTDLELTELLAEKINRFGTSDVQYQRSVPRGEASIRKSYHITEIRIEQTGLGWWNQFDMSEGSFNTFYFGKPKPLFSINNDNDVVLLHYNTEKPSDRDPIIK